MRFKPYKHGLSVECSPDEVSAVVERAIASFLKSGAKKVYLLVEPSVTIAGNPLGATKIASGQEPSNFLSSYRVIARQGEVTLVSPSERISSKQWREIAESIDV